MYYFRFFFKTIILGQSSKNEVKKKKGKLGFPVSIQEYLYISNHKNKIGDQYILFNNNYDFV